jgi:hypothetical protein
MKTRVYRILQCKINYSTCYNVYGIHRTEAGLMAGRNVPFSIEVQESLVNSVMDWRVKVLYA